MGTHANDNMICGASVEMQKAVNVTRGTVITIETAITACTTMNAMRSPPPTMRDLSYRAYTARLVFVSGSEWQRVMKEVHTALGEDDLHQGDDELQGSRLPHECLD